jgi:branched-chain amino acid aminotransferase
MIFEATPIVWHNGRLVPREQASPSIASHSLHLGIGVFDGIMAYWNGDRYYIHRLEAHLDRLRHSSTQMGLGFSWSNEDLKSGLYHSWMKYLQLITTSDRLFTVLGRI